MPPNGAVSYARIRFSSFIRIRHDAGVIVRWLKAASEVRRRAYEAAAGAQAMAKRVQMRAASLDERASRPMGEQVASIGHQARRRKSPSILEP